MTTMTEKEMHDFKLRIITETYEKLWNFPDRHYRIELDAAWMAIDDAITLLVKQRTVLRDFIDKRTERDKATILRDADIISFEQVPPCISGEIFKGGL